jgi:hypothetical protein
MMAVDKVSREDGGTDDGDRASTLSSTDLHGGGLVDAEALATLVRENQALKQVGAGRLRATLNPRSPAPRPSPRSRRPSPHAFARTCMPNLCALTFGLCTACGRHLLCCCLAGVADPAVRCVWAGTARPWPSCRPTSAKCPVT